MRQTAHYRSGAALATLIARAVCAVIRMLHHPGRDIRIESSMFQFGRPATQVLISGMGIMGVWVAMAGDWVVRAALYTTRFLQNTWLKKEIKAN